MSHSRIFQRELPGTRLAIQARIGWCLDDTGPVKRYVRQPVPGRPAQARRPRLRREWSSDRVFHEAGNGGQEIRNWLMVAAAVDDAPIDVIAYGAVASWMTGTAIARFEVATAGGTMNKPVATDSLLRVETGGCFKVAHALSTTSIWTAWSWIISSCECG